ncbi:MAG: integrase core domain-containing protein [Phenylobacterium sp.]
MLELIDQAVAAGWEQRRACRYLELDERRALRWMARRQAGTLEDLPVGGNPVHGLLDEELDAIVVLFDAWGEIDRSHRKLAHRGSREGLVWVSPASVLRVLAAHGLVLKAPHRAGRSERRPFPEWASYTKHSIWIYDVTHFAGCPKIAVVTIMDLVTRKWICELVSPEETDTQIQACFLDALESEGLLETALARRDQLADHADSFPLDAPLVPILLAVSDNGPQMTSGSTREFMAMCAIAQHFGRPGTPTDQAWIESLFSHIKADWPHLEKIRDPAVLRAELAVARVEYNTVRLHAGIGYVTPDDEHEGRGEAIRRARQAGLHRARRLRIAYHRSQRNQRQPPPPSDAD